MTSTGIGPLLSDSVTRIFTSGVTRSVLERAEQGEWPAELWQLLEDKGLTTPLVPEERGGAGATWRDAYDLVRLAGCFAVPGPFVETVLGSWLLSRAGIDVPRGPLTIAPRWDGLRLSRADGRLTLSGTATGVPWGRNACNIVLTTADDDGARVVLVETRHARTTAGVNLALEPRDVLCFSHAPVAASARALESLDARAPLIYGALVRSAQIAGALEGVLRMTVDHASTRRQFGKPIGAFQGVQWLLVALAGHSAAAGIAASNAFRAADRHDVAFEAAVAKVRAGEAAGAGAAIGHQLHGAIGFTYEHHLQVMTRRLWSWRSEFGGEIEWSAELGRAVLARGADALWPYITSRA